MRKFHCNFAKMRPRASLYQIYLSAGIDFKKLNVSYINQVRCNDYTSDTIGKNLRKGVRRHYKLWRERLVETSVAMEMLNYAPMIDNNIPDNEIWVYEDGEELPEVARTRRFD